MPATNPTIEQITIPINTHNHGITKPVFKITLNKLPTRIPKKIPMTAPKILMQILSNKNCLRTSLFVPPIALIKPTSLVRSLTATSIIFINPMAAPIKVIIPMAPAAPLTPAKNPMNISANLSLLSITKLSASVGISLLAFRIWVIVSPIAGVSSATLFTITPNE